MINNSNNLSTNLPKDLKIQLEILAMEDHLSVDNLIVNILNNHVRNEFAEFETHDDVLK